MGVVVNFEVEVSFVLLNPPEVSSFTVHCRGLRRDGLAESAHIVSAEEDVVLLYVILDKYKRGTYFVYRAGNKLLDLVPFPPRSSIGILPYSSGGSEGYVVAALSPLVSKYKYLVTRYSSKTKAVSTKLAPLICDCENDLRDILNHSTNKVIAVRDSMGWVDLWWGILVCNVLNKEDHVVRFIELPDPMPRNEHLFGISNPWSFQDVRCFGGLIKFIEVDCHRDDFVVRSDYRGFNFLWKAAVWQKVLPSYDFADWRQCFTVDTARMTITDKKKYSELFPELWSINDNKLNLQRLMFSCPTLRMDADVFYMKSLVRPTSLVAWLAAVNMKEGPLELVSFTAEGFYNSTEVYLICNLHFSPNTIHS